MIRFSMPIRGQLVMLGILGGLALIGLLTANTDAACDSWGYVVQSPMTCAESGGLWLARVAGIAFAWFGVQTLWHVAKGLWSR